MGKHTCSTIAFHCIDFRTIKETMKFLDNKCGLGNCDIVSVAGSGKGIADDNEVFKNYLIRQIKLSHDLHQSKTVILIHHSDCGVYNNCYEFNSGEEERQKQIEDMKKSEAVIKEIFPDMTVEKVWAQLLDSHGEKIEFIAVD
ncbi:MAG: carbonic anhydrase [Minisyncoccales bacterium]